MTLLVDTSLGCQEIYSFKISYSGIYGYKIIFLCVSQLVLLFGSEKFAFCFGIVHSGFFTRRETL